MDFYRALLLLYPRPFRRRYGDEMAEAFARLRGKTKEERGLPGVAWLWTKTVADAAVSGTAERIRPERVHDQQDGGMTMTTTRRVVFHFKQAVTSLRRAPGYTAAFVLTLGLAIGVNSAVFSVVNGVLLQPLPFQDAERILYVKQPVEASNSENVLFSFMEIDDYRASSATIDEWVEVGDWEFTVLDENEPHRAVGGLVTSNYFSVLGMRPALGRLLDATDDAEGSEPVMLLTHGYWERVFGSDPAAVGRVLRLEDQFIPEGAVRIRIVGVLEPGLHYTGSRQPDFYLNYSSNSHYQDAAMRDARDHRMTQVFARIAPDANVVAARSELAALTDQFHRRHPEFYPDEAGFGIDAVPWRAQLTDRGRSTFLFLMGTVALVLLLAAANVTNLTLTRLIRRENELATRAALGASRGELRWHLTAEHVLLGLAGGVLGVGLAFLSRESLVAYASRFTVRAQEVGVDWMVLTATLGGGMLLAAALAWLPGLPIGSPERITSAQSKATESRWRKRLQRGLVVGQLALSFTLLTGAGLLVRSLVKLTSVDLGFTTEQIVIIETPTGPGGIPMPGQEDPGWEGALDEIRAFPGVRTAATATWTPLSGREPRPMVGRATDRADMNDPYLTSFNDVSTGYFESLGIPLVAGRYFERSDGQGSTPVVIVNESMARAYFGGDDPIGRSIEMQADFSVMFFPGTFEVVGVVEDTKEYGVDVADVHTFYRPAAMNNTYGPEVIVAYQGDAAPVAEHVRQVIERMDPDRAVDHVRMLAALVDDEVAPSRLNAILFGSFAALALLIAAVGVLGTLAFSVSQRVREFGIRMALGAQQRRILRNVLGEGVALVAGALLIGSCATLVLGRFLSAWVFEVGTTDVWSMAAAGLLLGTVALTAALVPAVRATRVHPSEALKSE